MAKHLRIKPSDKMSDAINNNAQILMSMSRFGISLGFGEKCIKDVWGQCKKLRGKFINCYLCLQIHSLWS